jgi:alpha-glucosidase
MPWRAGRGGGFTTARPWLPLPADADTRNVERQAADPSSVLAWYRRLLRLRGATPALQAGEQHLLDAGSANVLAYLRDPAPDSENDRDPGALVALNFGEARTRVTLPPPVGGGTWRVAASSGTRPEGQIAAESAELEPSEALVLVTG